MCANRQLPAGIGNDHGRVGRCFAEHPRSVFGHLLLEDATKASGAVRARNVVTVDTEVMERLGLPGVKIVVRSDPNASGGFKRRLVDRVCRSDPLVDALAWAGGPVESCPWDGYLYVSLEQYPLDASYVKLNGEKDRFGNPRIDLHWSLAPAEKEAARTAAVLFAADFAAAGSAASVSPTGCSRRSSTFETSLSEAGGPPTCAPRDGGRPRRRGRRPCKVFGIGNLYVAGSSVFATAGHCNPTFTIVQLRLRLADHLNAAL